MGIFDFLKRKQNTNLTVHKKSIINYSQNKDLSIKGLSLHNDIKDLIWIGDGKFKNYNQTKEKVNSIDLNGIKIEISLTYGEEPSLIYTNQQVKKPKNVEDIERPPYYPSYSELSPEQKWIYLNFLSNPYNSSINIGFVFILYYGLERHLLFGNLEKAIEVILKLRDIHSNKSFQAYSANAIVLSCILHQRADLALKFIKSLDKDYELHFSDNLFLICYFSFGIPILPKDIIRMCKTFEFKNMNYIKKYPDFFLECLKNTMREELDTESINIKKYLTSSETKKVKKEDISIFANISIIDKSISIPLFSENFKLKKEMNNLLEISHNKVKKEISEMKKHEKLFKNTLNISKY